MNRQEAALLSDIQCPALHKKDWISRRDTLSQQQAWKMGMNLTSDAKQTVYLEDIPVGRLVDEGVNQVFYVPGDGGFSQRLLPLNGIRLPCKGKTRTLEAFSAFRILLKNEA